MDRIFDSSSLLQKAINPLLPMFRIFVAAGTFSFDLWLLLLQFSGSGRGL
jgi:hypothetical protein